MNINLGNIIKEDENDNNEEEEKKIKILSDEKILVMIKTSQY